MSFQGHFAASLEYGFTGSMIYGGTCLQQNKKKNIIFTKAGFSLNIIIVKMLNVPIKNLKLINWEYHPKKISPKDTLTLKTGKRPPFPTKSKKKTFKNALKK